MRAAGFRWVFTCKTRDYAAIIAGEFPDGLGEIVPAYSAFIRIMVDGISFDARSMYYMHQGISQVSGIGRTAQLVIDHLELASAAHQAAHGLDEVAPVRRIEPGGAHDYTAAR